MQTQNLYKGYAFDMESSWSDMDPVRPVAGHGECYRSSSCEIDEHYDSLTVLPKSSVSPVFGLDKAAMSIMQTQNQYKAHAFGMDSWTFFHADAWRRNSCTKFMLLM